MNTKPVVTGLLTSMHRVWQGRLDVMRRQRDNWRTLFFVQTVACTFAVWILIKYGVCT